MMQLMNGNRVRKPGGTVDSRIQIYLIKLSHQICQQNTPSNYPIKFQPKHSEPSDSCSVLASRVLVHSTTVGIFRKHWLDHYQKQLISSIIQQSNLLFQYNIKMAQALRDLVDQKYKLHQEIDFTNLQINQLDKTIQSQRNILYELQNQFRQLEENLDCPDELKQKIQHASEQLININQSQFKLYSSIASMDLKRIDLLKQINEAKVAYEKQSIQQQSQYKTYEQNNNVTINQLINLNTQITDCMKTLTQRIINLEKQNQ
ncbi:Hypothetical_protein [Hexamita inflata]|uniref:Hypothetical_protein n=1 Tax=Hexamita inflata TaxID=28002 RepID=A0AA86QKV2_9EUKA|nr:Hypothetical protein HINF_LOCUS41230 [Hexamita inflata]